MCGHLPTPLLTVGVYSTTLVQYVPVYKLLFRLVEFI
jgi:hypothetical protein